MNNLQRWEMIGKIRVGRICNNIKPKYKDYTSILCLTPFTPYGSLGPYVLKDKRGRIMENIWQFSKVYEEVPYSKERYSRWDNTIIWEHPSERHVSKNGKVLRAYYNWRKKGMYNKYPVRYPVGFSYRNKCLYSLYKKQKLDYISSRKKIYLPTYCRLVKKEPQFIELAKRLENGENLLIIEVDGPHQESLSYYQQKYGVGDNFIKNNTIKINKQNIDILLNDPKHPFGHGYCLAIALLGLIEI